MDTVSGFHAEGQQATASEGLAQGPYMATTEGFEPAILRTKGVESTNEQPRPTRISLSDKAGKYASMQLLHCQNIPCNNFKWSPDWFRCPKRHQDSSRLRRDQYQDDDDRLPPVYPTDPSDHNTGKQSETLPNEADLYTFNTNILSDPTFLTTKKNPYSWWK